MSWLPGMRLPAVYTATGKAMLSGFSAEELEARLPKVWPAPLTPAGVTSQDFAVQVAKWRALGYAVDEEEVRPGMLCLGVPVWAGDDKPICGLAVSLTLAEARDLDLSQLASALRSVAEALGPLYEGRI